MFGQALGDYTKQIADFSKLPEREFKGDGCGGDLWFDKVLGAFFDDVHFKAVQAMSKLSCSICDENNVVSTKPPLSSTQGQLPKGFIFRTLDALKRHYDKAHNRYMCYLCLEGKKVGISSYLLWEPNFSCLFSSLLLWNFQVFVSEQKLYSHAELDQHSESGNSEVDGSEIDRGGFKGHPLCKFCNRRFYGDNELFYHMSHDHYTCFLCQKYVSSSLEPRSSASANLTPFCQGETRELRVL
jgi:E3 ubiquitin-protein ligase ZNF598